MAVGLFKYSERVYDACIRSFNALPLAAIIDKRFFCVHGGISPELGTLRDLEKVSITAPRAHPPLTREQLNRFQEPGSHGLLVDLLWADPVPTYGHEQEDGKIPPGTMFINNGARGCSFYYTYVAPLSSRLKLILNPPLDTKRCVLSSIGTICLGCSGDTKHRMQAILCIGKHRRRNSLP